MTSKWSRLVAALLATSMVAAACGSDSDSDGGSAASEKSSEASVADADSKSSEEAIGDDTSSAMDDDSSAMDEEVMADHCEATVPGTEVTYAGFAGTRSLDVPYSSAWALGGTALMALYDSLLVWNPETGIPDPHLAESMVANDDGSVWTLKLQPGIEFEDGTPYDAANVVASQSRFLIAEGDQPIVNATAGFMNSVKESKIIDDLTVEYTLNQPWKTFNNLFAGELGMIVNVNAIGDDVVAFGGEPPSAAGVGPYTLESRTPGEEIVLTARDDYWGGPVCIETLISQESAGGAVIGFDAAYEAFENGDRDLAFLRTANSFEAARANDEVEITERADGSVNIIFNMGDGEVLADDVALREAIALAIDPAVIDDRAFAGIGALGKAMLVEGSPLFSSDVVELPTDAARAAEIVTENGLEGTSLRLFSTTAPENVEIALAAEAMLEAIGLEIEVSSFPTGETIGLMVAGDFDMTVWSNSAGHDTAVGTWVRNLLSTSTTNRQHYGSDEMDTLLGELMASDADGIPAAVTNISNFYNENFLGVMLGYLDQGYVVAPHVKGVRMGGRMALQFHDAYIEE